MRHPLRAIQSRLAAWLRTPDQFDRVMPVVFFLAVCGLAVVAAVIHAEG